MSLVRPGHTGPRRLMVINVVGLTYGMIGEDTPHIRTLMQCGFARPMETVLPAVTCSVQATMLTGQLPAEHGIVANGWYFRDLAEVMFWKQSNHLIQGDKVWHSARQRDDRHTTAMMFWWYNMYAAVDWSVTPRPSYPADGRKIADIYTDPPELREQLQTALGMFPLFHFWGPTADIISSRWITDASLRVWREQKPALMFVYLPHLDYNLQRLGPEDQAVRKDIREVDVEVGRLMEVAAGDGAEVIVLSEYGITATRGAIALNRVLREHGWLRVRREPLGYETLDCGASRAFAVADHQVAHIYIRNPADIPPVRKLLEQVDGVESVLDRQQQAAFGINHERSGELVAVSGRDMWFSYYFWLDDRVAPDYARTVDIHRKPGYDPVELFVNPELRYPKLKIAARLLQKKLGFRYYMDMIGLDATIVRGSHGRLPERNRLETDGPVFVCSSKDAERDDLHVRDVRNLILQLQFPA